MAYLPKWLEDARFYEIYPQSFFDSNGDGVGDLPGILQKLDYIQGLGCNAVWLNPIFVSPFCDAGYDVQDYCAIAPRYGTIRDLEALLAAMHLRGMHLLLDLVPGHTSDQHPWFLESSKPERNRYSDRYIWSAARDEPGWGLAESSGGRDGKYHFNFYTVQPSLNYGYAQVTKDWQMPAGCPAARDTIDAMQDVIRFWLDKGVDGFRVDMAFSLVKEDGPGRPETQKVWREIFGAISQVYPEAAFVSEWGVPDEAIPAGFAMDFYLQMNAAGFNLLFDFGDPEDLDAKPFFSPRGEGDARAFSDEFQSFYDATKGKGYICWMTGNHDIYRRPKALSDHQIKLAYAFLYTMPGIPFLYYGDEIGMRQINDLDPVEGSMFRTGARTPMQWNRCKNAGFSTADEIYLPIDPDPGRPTVAKQDNDPDSLLNTVRRLSALRASHPSLANGADFAFLYAEDHTYPLLYGREGGGETLVIAVNPAARTCSAPLPCACGDDILFRLGNPPHVEEKRLVMPPESFVIFRVYRQK